MWRLSLILKDILLIRIIDKKRNIKIRNLLIFLFLNSSNEKSVEPIINPIKNNNTVK